MGRANTGAGDRWPRTTTSRRLKPLVRKKRTTSCATACRALSADVASARKTIRKERLISSSLKKKPEKPTSSAHSIAVIRLSKTIEPVVLVRNDQYVPRNWVAAIQPKREKVNRRAY